MPKKVSTQEKEELIAAFINGETVDYLAEKYKCSKITISRHLKKNIEEKQYKELIKKNNNKNNELKSRFTNNLSFDNSDLEKSENDYLNLENSNDSNAFLEITPLNLDIDNVPQKDLSSVPISEVEFPNVVYMVVDKRIELETKFLSEYPEWQFLSQEELNRKTIEVFVDLKVAKRSCTKEQKVIKVPNTNVFKIAASTLLEKGITRIVSANKLISL